MVSLKCKSEFRVIIDYKQTEKNMTLKERLEFCQICTNRKMDLKIGLICNLTDVKPAFEKFCPDFVKDEIEAERKLHLKMDAAGNVETSRGSKPRQNKIIGVVVFAIGLAVTVGSFTIGFGSYVIIAYGAIIYGISRYIKGIHQERILRTNEILNDKISKTKK
jgi:hypothetical protein